MRQLSQNLTRKIRRSLLTSRELPTQTTSQQNQEANKAWMATPTSSSVLDAHTYF